MSQQWQLQKLTLLLLPSSLVLARRLASVLHRGSEDSDEDLFVDLSGCNIKSRHASVLDAELMAVFAARSTKQKPKLVLSPELPNNPLLAFRSPSSVGEKTKAKLVKSGRQSATHDGQQDGDIVVVLD